MKPPLQRIRLCIVLVVLAVALNGCLFGGPLSVFVADTAVFISFGDINVGLCDESDPGVFLCSFGELLSTFQTLSTPELLATLFLLDPVVLQLPVGVTNFTGSFLHNTSGTGGALTITAGLTSLPIDAERSLVAEPGTQFVVIGLPAAAPTSGNFSFNFNFDARPSLGESRVSASGGVADARMVEACAARFSPPRKHCARADSAH